MSKFEVGDKVIFLEHNCDEGFYKIGSEYTISNVIDGTDYYVKEIDGCYILGEQLKLVDRMTNGDGTLAVTTENEPQKFNKDKPRTDLISGEFTLALGKALGYGAEKYSEVKGETPNYLKGTGFLYSDLIGALERHLAKFKSGVDIDDESQLEHIIQVAVNAMFLYNYSISDKGVDDRILLKKEVDNPT